jgi:hypothetical protein
MNSKEFMLRAFVVTKTVEIFESQKISPKSYFRKKPKMRQKVCEPFLFCFCGAVLQEFAKYCVGKFQTSEIISAIIQYVFQKSISI